MTLPKCANATWNSYSTRKNMPEQTKKVALFSPHLTNIGEKDTIPRLAKSLVDQGFSVDLLAAWKEWDHLKDAPPDPAVNIVSLNTRKLIPYIPNITPISSWAAYRVWAAAVSAGMLPGLIRYLRKNQPDALVARMLTTPAIMASVLAKARTKMVLSMAGFPRESAIRRYLWPRLYPKADAFVTPVPEVAEQASFLSGVPGALFRVIPNPVIDDTVLSKAKETPSHPWLSESRTVPVVLAAGRLTRQKGYRTLINAFAIVRRQTPCRLLILGEGELRGELQQLAATLSITEHIELRGFEPNPYSYMRAADIFVLSSEWEGPGHSLIEAVSLGTPSVTTNCPAGPSHTVMDGKAGLLTPVGDPPAMAEAILKLLKDPELASKLAKRGKANAKRYTPATVGKEWAALLNEITAP